MLHSQDGGVSQYWTNEWVQLHQPRTQPAENISTIDNYYYILINQ